jgi:hypothetical protein
MTERFAIPLVLSAALWIAGCSLGDYPGESRGGLFDAPGDEYGKTYYLDGAGNWGFGLRDVPAGLRAAGYKGNVEAYIWTSSFNPAIDQINIGMNKLRARILTSKIEDYLRRYPKNNVNLISLSAGTGIAVWAVEAMSPPYKVNNLILLGSSLSADYDMRKAFQNIRGKVYVYYSPHDEVLGGIVRTIGTVDRAGTESAGLGGLHPPGGPRDRIVNIGWRPQYEQYGWTGSHTDATNEAFVQRFISKHIIDAPSDASPRASGSRQTTRPVTRSEWRR